MIMMAFGLHADTAKLMFWKTNFLFTSIADDRVNCATKLSANTASNVTGFGYAQECLTCR